MKINDNITFRNLNNSDDDFKKIYNWCQEKFVYEWFEQRKLSYDEIVNKYKSKIDKGKQKLFIIKLNNEDIGLIQIYKYKDDLNLKIKDAYEYDLFIGKEEYLNKGIGSVIINKINNIIFNEYNADYIILRPFKRNVRAVKCYLKCGFKEIKEYTGSDTLGNLEEILVLLLKKE